MNHQFISLEDFKKELGSWREYLSQFLQSEKFVQIYEQLKSQITSGKKVQPPVQNIFHAFKLTPLSDVKAVILNQDPYNSFNQSMGLSFSVLKPHKPPPSLKNVFKNLQNDPKIKFVPTTHGDLTQWADRGVFLLNSTLTVRQQAPLSHKNIGWQQFTDYVLTVINKQCTNIVFLLWGKPSQNKVEKIIDPEKHKILKTSHPSPLSANSGFSQSRHFSQCNDYLQSLGKTPINWQLSEDSAQPSAEPQSQIPKFNQIPNLLYQDHKINQSSSFQNSFSQKTSFFPKQSPSLGHNLGYYQQNAKIKYLQNENAANKAQIKSLKDSLGTLYEKIEQLENTLKNVIEQKSNQNSIFTQTKL